MSHTAHALLLHCIDFRFQQIFQKFIADKGLIGRVDVLSVAGAAKNFANPAQESDREFLLRQIDISVKLHAIQRVLLVNHQDCGAYGGSAAFPHFEHEEKQYKKDMELLKDAIVEKYPDIIVENYIALLAGDVVEV